ncbi:metal-dependent hydrolase [Kineosporia sp. J2-2]|uniref:Metal-dependent hydrolase n=1 Tax=Kineosporia corallincola TaxID=2835133 RepID=A0ABS5TN20_9ACTN|nr:metal-dependent hydrolase [Kineosporia corallincola]MBT0771779.1 metal-dependent hydrolase [Kineosporia corallincola]
MMNSTHGPTGLATGLLAATTYRAVVETPPLSLTVWLLASSVAGALLIDMDHHSSSPARLWGPLTRVPAAALGKLAGGHRAATHDLSKGAPIAFAIVLAAGLMVPQLVAGIVADVRDPGVIWVCQFAARLTGMAVIALIAGLAFVGAAAFIPGRWEGDGVWNFIVSWLTAGAVSFAYPSGLPSSVVLVVGGGVALGVVVGIAGDAMTVSGVPCFGRARHLLPRGFRISTDSRAEVLLVRVPVLLLCWWLGWRLARDGYGFFGLQPAAYF